MRNWPDCWEEVEAALRLCISREQAVQRAGEIRGAPTTWDALARAGRRLGRPVEDLVGEAKPDGIKSEIAIMAELGILTPYRNPPPSRRGKKHLVIPDTQVKPGVPLRHFTALGRYIVAKGPDVVVHLGDHRDMPSFSSFDSAARKAYRGDSWEADFDSGRRALELLEEELVKGGFQPAQKILLRGNHDCFGPWGRVGRYLADNPSARDTFTEERYAPDWELGWEVVPFLQPITVDGVKYCHLFSRTSKGTVTGNSVRTGAASARAQVQAQMMSCTAGHKQGLDTYIHHTDDNTLRGIIAGSFYMHDEEYIGPAGNNNYWRGVLLKHDVRESNPNHYDLCEVSLDFLLERYGK